MVRFDWSAAKERKNHRKHGVTFAEAQTAFDDPLAHSEEESRELMVGYSLRGRLLVVSFLEGNDTIRIISAREADPTERQRHEEENL